MLPVSSFCADKIFARRWSLLRNHQHLNTFRMSKTEGPSSSDSRGPGASGRGSVGTQDVGEGLRARGEGTVILVPLAGEETERGGCRVLLKRRYLFCKGVEVMVVKNKGCAFHPV